MKTIEMTEHSFDGATPNSSTAIKLASNGVLYLLLCILLYPVAIVLFFVFLATFGNTTSFERKTIYKPLSGAYQQIAIHSKGTYEQPNYDQIVEENVITLSLTTHRGEVFTKETVYRCHENGSAKQFYHEFSDALALGEWVKSLEINIPEETLEAEMAELKTMLWCACLGYSPPFELKAFVITRYK